MSRSILSSCIASAAALTLAACGGINALVGNAQALPATNAGQTAYPAPTSLAPLPLGASDWSTIEARKVTPTCDARQAKPVADADGMARAKSVLDRWAAVGGPGGGTVKIEAKSDVGEATITLTTPVNSFQSGSLECGDHAALVVNGRTVPFDLAYATSSHPGAPPDDIDLMLTALSIKNGSLVSIVVRPSAKYASFAMTDVRQYTGEPPPEPIVYAPTGLSGGTFSEHDYFFKSTTAPGTGVYVMSRPSGNGNPSNLFVGKFVQAQ